MVQPINGRQIIRQVALHDKPCPNCGCEAVIVGLMHEVRPLTNLFIAQKILKTPTNPQEELTKAEGLGAYSLCLYCLRRERWIGGGDDWQRVVIAPGIHVEEHNDATASTSDR
jgi:hypothetical protein